MKAIVYSEYGGPEKLQLREIARPVPKENEVLIRIHATSINDWDWALLQGVPFANRMMSGLKKPKIEVLGSDIAGVVEYAGSKVSQFKVGDKVFGDLSGLRHGGWGGFAEFVAAPESALFIIPNDMTYAQAAALPQAAALAIQGLLDKGPILPGQSLLINGASGGVGSLAIQIAKAMHAGHIAAVCSKAKMPFVESLGVDEIIDYQHEDFTRNGKQYDFILDVKGFHSILDYRRALKPSGRYVMLGGATSSINQIMFLGPLLSLFGDKKLRILFLKTNKGLDSVIKMFEKGQLLPVIDKTYPLEQTANAMKYYGEGHAQGKVVILPDVNE